MICGSRGSKSRRAKAAGAEPSGQIRDETIARLVATTTTTTTTPATTTTTNNNNKLH